MNKRKLYLAYYLTIGCFILAQVFYTLYQTSVLVSHGRKQSNLEKNQSQLLVKKQLLQENLAKETSLLAFSETETLESYQLISNPIIIDKSLSLAAAN